MLIGQYKSKLTEKFRISVPKKIRQELGDKLVVAKWYENCLVMVSGEGWNKLIGRLTGRSETIISPVRKIDRFILASGFEIELDNQGRFVVPEVLLKHAQITGEVVFVGLGDRVEIWSENGWVELEKEIQEEAGKAVEEIARLKK